MITSVLKYDKQMQKRVRDGDLRMRTVLERRYVVGSEGGKRPQVKAQRPLVEARRDS